MPVNIEMPVLVILLGILFMIARMPLIPVPKWVTDERRMMTTIPGSAFLRVLRGENSAYFRSGFSACSVKG